MKLGYTADDAVTGITKRASRHAGSQDKREHQDHLLHGP